MSPRRTFPTRCPRACRAWQRGFSIVSAIFLLVVLAALGAYMLSLSATQHTAASLDIQGARAYQAAHAGIEWAAYQGIKNAATYACTTGAAASDTMSFSGVLATFSTRVDCRSSVYDEAGNMVRVYAITSTATSGAPGSIDYVQRVLTATVSYCTAPGGGAC
jgi:MSHA biogenesis protein MshP